MRGGAVRAVRTASGERFEVDAAVLATGPAVPAMAAELGITIPDATPIALLVTTKPLPHDLTAVLNTPRVSLRPAPGGALAVDSDWPNASITQAADGGYRVPEAVVTALLAEASGVLSGIHDWRPTGPASAPSPFPVTATRYSVGSTTCRGPVAGLHPQRCHARPDRRRTVGVRNR